ncbi:hypothetical protein GCM10010992_15380 [Cloacibacterium rupense]|uniref:Lipoprotein n=1 Tax=Cloacibacterium rupense TaxID=517423 RepID=A0ABQ2NK12_9FLAO|nr:hypothetical protein [Cloacibacterium rupense]GGP04229.1 hypothetical protein GCM10010992_15380 [Cloacibacterium rupense]
MKKQATFFRIVATTVLFTILSCNKNPNSTQNIISSENADSASLKIDPLAHIPMPAKLDSAMRQSFDKETYQELKKLNKKNGKSFYITKENYLKMIDNLPVDADRVSFSFVQFNSAKFPGKYKELSKFDGSLYMLYSYIDKSGKILAGKAYAVLSVKDALEIPEADFNIMFEDYKTNIKPKIDRFVKGPQGNTLSVRITRTDLEAYKARMTTKKDIGKFKITLAQWQPISNFTSKDQQNSLLNKLSGFTDDNVGQMTFITDCVGANGQNINSLSGDDFNSFCPTDCD